MQRYQTKVIPVERDFEKWYPSVTVLLERLSSWKDSVMATLDQFLDYVGLRCLSEALAGIFPRNQWF